MRFRHDDGVIIANIIMVDAFECYDSIDSNGKNIIPTKATVIYKVNTCFDSRDGSVQIILLKKTRNPLYNAFPLPLCPNCCLLFYHCLLLSIYAFVHEEKQVVFVSENPGWLPLHENLWKSV